MKSRESEFTVSAYEGKNSFHPTFLPWTGFLPGSLTPLDLPQLHAWKPGSYFLRVLPGCFQMEPATFLPAWPCAQTHIWSSLELPILDWTGKRWLKNSVNCAFWPSGLRIFQWFRSSSFCLIILPSRVHNGINKMGWIYLVGCVGKMWTTKPHKWFGHPILFPKPWQGKSESSSSKWSWDFHLMLQSNHPACPLPMKNVSRAEWQEPQSWTWDTLDFWIRS